MRYLTAWFLITVLFSGSWGDLVMSRARGQDAPTDAIAPVAERIAEALSWRDQALCFR